MSSVRTITTLALLLAATTTHGGAAVDVPVDVDLENRSASGNMVSAAYSKDDGELIGCGLRNFSDGNGGMFQFGFCQATDPEGDNIVCSTEDPLLLAAVSGISDNSFITFGWDEFDTCIRIGVSTQSFYLPKGKARKATE